MKVQERGEERQERNGNERGKIRKRRKTKDDEGKRGE